MAGESRLNASGGVKVPGPPAHEEARPDWPSATWEHTHWCPLAHATALALSATATSAPAASAPARLAPGAFPLTSCASEVGAATPALLRHTGGASPFASLSHLFPRPASSPAGGSTANGSTASGSTAAGSTAGGTTAPGDGSEAGDSGEGTGSGECGEPQGWGLFGRERGDLFFARVSERRGYAPPPSPKKSELFSVYRVRPDGRCMFRALVRGMSTNKGVNLRADEETSEADELRLAVADALCHSEKRRAAYEEALIAITVEESLKRYCQRILRSDFWGGESELLVLSRMCSQPIIVYIPESKARRDGARWGSGFVPIAEYGGEYLKASKAWKGRKPVRLLYNGINHYDLLL